jgi:TonB family protein
MALSLALHGALLAIVLYRPAPSFVRPSSVRAGQYGTSVTPLYFAQRGSDALGDRRKAGSGTSASLQYGRKRVRKPRESGYDGENTSSGLTLPSTDARTAKQSASAGSPYGSLWEGSTTGFEIKPALPVVGPQPQVYTPNLPRGFEGDVVVEITIDEQGNITNRVLVRGLGNGLDEQAIAALQNWRFRPATRDGVAIPSKQDVYFHFVGTRS